MTHLDNLGELAHQTEQEERVIVNKVSVSIDETILGENTHSYGLIVLGGGKILAEGLERRLAEIANVVLFFPKFDVAVNYNRENDFLIRVLLLQLFCFLLD